MIFLLVLVVAWAILVLPNAKKARFSGPWMSARRYRASMLLVAPRSGAQIRLASRRVERSTKGHVLRRREIIVFLASGAASAGMVATLADRSEAWPVAGFFTALFLMYTAAVVESDRRKGARRAAARRRAAAERAAVRAAEIEEWAIASGDA